MNEAQTDPVIPGLGPGLYAEWRAANIGVITDRLERALTLELASDLTKSGRRSTSARSPFR